MSDLLALLLTRYIASFKKFGKMKKSLHVGWGGAILCAVFFPGEVAQLVRAPDCRSGGRGFEPRPSRHLLCEFTLLSCCCDRAAPYAARFFFTGKFGSLEDWRLGGAPEVEARAAAMGAMKLNATRHTSTATGDAGALANGRRSNRRVRGGTPTRLSQTSKRPNFQASL